MIYNPQFSSGCPFDWVLLAKGAMGVLILAMTQLGITNSGFIDGFLPLVKTVNMIPERYVLLGFF